MIRSKHIALAFCLASLLTAGLSQATLGAHAVRIQGSGTVLDASSVDLDNGNFSASKTTRDFKFDEYDVEARYLVTSGTTRMLRMDAKPGYQACKAAPLGSYTFNIAFIEANSWFCAKTKQGRYARFQVEQIYAHPNGFTINFTTWA